MSNFQSVGNLGSFSTSALRTRLKAYYKAVDQYWRLCDMLIQQPELEFDGHRDIVKNPTDMLPVLPGFPEECRGMLCGALTRSGSRCRNSGTMFRNGRCKFHGGMSTGPTSVEGKSRSAKNGRRLKRKSRSRANPMEG